MGSEMCIRDSHKYQLVAYALLIDEASDTCVKRGFINYIPEKMIRELKIDRSMKIYVKRVLGAIKRIISEEKLPQRKVSKRKCGGWMRFQFPMLRINIIPL